jgi:hypothetical protein
MPHFHHLPNPQRRRCSLCDAASFEWKSEVVVKVAEPSNPELIRLGVGDDLHLERLVEAVVVASPPSPPPSLLVNPAKSYNPEDPARKVSQSQDLMTADSWSMG